MAQVSLKNIQAPLAGGGALQGVNLEVRDREFLVLAGPSGSGNSTVLRLLAGLESPSGGELFVGTRPVNGLPPQERGVALVLPKGGLFPQATGAANIALGLQGRHFAKAEVAKRTLAAAEVAGVNPEVLALRPAAMTAVQRLRVALARAIVGQPKAILLDDPLAVLDADARVGMRGELVKLQERLQTTFLHATADPLEAMALGHRAALFETGRLRQVDAPLALYDHPEDRFVAGFLGRPQMNFLAGQLHATREGLLFKETQGTVEVALAERPAELAGREVTLGFRPEDVRPADDTLSPKARGGRCQGLVEHAEATGADVFYTVQTGGHTLVIRGVAGEEPRGVGRRMAFDIALEKAYLFDAVSGERIP